MVTLNLERINQASPYIIRPTNDALKYQFVTDYMVAYEIGFVPDELLICAESYQFIIINTNNRKSPRDPKIRETVFAFVYEFFRQQDVVLLYLCETSDNKQHPRQRLFESWVSIAQLKYPIAKLTIGMEDAEGVMNYAALIFRSDNPHAAEISVEFTRTVQLLSEKPE